MSTVIYRPRAVNVLVLDVEGDDVITSVGVDIIVNIKATLNRNGCEYAIINLNPQIKKVFEITRLTPILDVFENKNNLMNTLVECSDISRATKTLDDSEYFFYLHLPSLGTPNSYC